MAVSFTYGYLKKWKDVGTYFANIYQAGMRNLYTYSTVASKIYDN